MSTIEHPVIAVPQSRTERKGSILAYWLSSTDHKIIGHLYLITSFFFFLCAGVMAMLMRISCSARTSTSCPTSSTTSCSPCTAR